MNITVAEVNLSAIEHNIAYARTKLPAGVRIMAVVKANAYGHGILPVARAAVEAGAACLAVAQVDEGVTLREAGISAPILTLGGSLRAQLQDAVRHDLAFACYCPEQVHMAAQFARVQRRPARVHIKVETGMHRLGARPGAQIAAIMQAIQANKPWVRVEGVYSHFANAEAQNAYTAMQMDCFNQACRQIRAAGYTPYAHLANSASILALPQAAFDCVRLGIAMYGLDPSGKPNTALRPALRWYTQVVQVAQLEPGEVVGYGGTWQAQRPARLATLPVGYADGLRRSMSGRASLLIRGRPAPIAGRVCMDHCMVDVTDIPDACVGDEAVLIGEQQGARITAEDLAALCDTISYEVCTSIGSRVTRLYSHD